MLPEHQLVFDDLKRQAEKDFGEIIFDYPYSFYPSFDNTDDLISKIQIIEDWLLENNIVALSFPLSAIGKYKSYANGVHFSKVDDLLLCKLIF